jgi:dinuclear metal center YbgI/SA1388 family protein
MEIRQVIDFLKEKFPLDLQEDWDNSGLQIGNIDRNVENVLISLDLEDEAIDMAIEKNCKLIINHHPFFFSDLKSIDLSDPKGKKIEKLIKNDIAVFAMHTNLDAAKGGVNDNLCDILSIKDRKVLEISDQSQMARYGNIDPIKAKDFAKIVKKELDAEAVILYGDEEKEIKKVAVCGGAGSDFLEDAVRRSCDLMITGDIKYHQALDYMEKGLIILDPGHFASENHIIYKLEEILNEFENLNIFTYSKGDNFRKFI